MIDEREDEIRKVWKYVFFNMRKKDTFASNLYFYFRNGALKYSTEIYKNQPGRIEDYEPGHSSIAEKEAKEVLYRSRLEIRQITCLYH